MPDNRELALLIAVTVLLVLALAYRPTRRPTLRVLGCLFWSRLTVAGLGAAHWFAGALVAMAWFNLWDWADLKNTFLWFATSGCLLVFQGIQAKNPNTEFRGIIADQFKFALFFDLVVNMYPFSLLAELLLLVGTSFLAMLLAFSELDPKHAPAKRVFGFLLSLVVIFVVGFSIFHLFTEPEEVFSWSGLRAFALPIYFTLMMLPYAWLLTVHAAYETLFVTKVARHEMMPQSVRRYAKWRLFMICKLNANAVRRAQGFLPVDFRWSETRAVVDTELLRLREELQWNKPPE